MKKSERFSQKNPTHRRENLTKPEDSCFREQKADVANLRKDFISLKEYNRVQVTRV